MSVWAKVWAYQQHPKRLDENRKLTAKKHPAAKAVLVALAEYPGVGQRDCWPSQVTLADMTDFTERQVRACLADLEDQSLIKRHERRRQDGSRRSDRITLLGPVSAFGPSEQDADSDTENQPEESSGSQPEESSNQPEESSGHEPVVSKNRNTSEDFTNVQSSGEADKPPSPSPEKEEPKPVPMGSYAVGFLMDRLKEAKEGGAHPPPLLGKQKAEYGAFFEQAAKDGESVEDCEMALRWLVAKASGEVENEPEAWAYFGSGQRAVRDGWRPKVRLRAVRDPERDAEWDEILRQQQEIIGAVG